MTNMGRHNSKTPTKSTAAYQIGALLFQYGPMPLKDIFRMYAYKANDWSRRELMQKWIDNGWFERQDDKIALTEFAFAYMEGTPAAPDKPKFVGIPATGCAFNMLTRPPYKSPRTYRREGPEWAQRPAGFGFKSAIGAKEVAL